MEFLKSESGEVYFNIDHIIRITPTYNGSEFYLTNGQSFFYPGKPKEFVELLKNHANNNEI